MKQKEFKTYVTPTVHRIEVGSEQCFAASSGFFDGLNDSFETDPEYDWITNF